MQSCERAGDPGLFPAGKMDEGQSVCVYVCVYGGGGGVASMVIVWGEGSHYRLTVTVTSSSTMGVHPGELDGGQATGCAKVAWTCAALSFFTSILAKCVHDVDTVLPYTCYIHIYVIYNRMKVAVVCVCVQAR